MKTISSLFTLLALFVATAACAQPPEKKPLPDIRIQDNTIYIPYITLPRQEIAAQIYGGQYIPNGTIMIPWQNPEIAHPNVRVELNLNRAPIQEALKKLFTQVKMDFMLEKDVPANARITLRLKNVTFLTALNAITEEANVGWNVETVGSTLRFDTYHIGKNLSNRNINIYGGPRFQQYLPLNYLNQNLPLNYWNLQPGNKNNQISLPDNDNNRFNLYYNVTPDINSNGLYNLQPGIKPNDAIYPGNTILLPLNYNFIQKLTPSLDLNNTIKLPLNYNFNNSIKLDGPVLLKVNTTQEGAATLTDKANTPQEGIPVLKDIPLIGRLFTVHGKEERSIFTCPHCHQEITVIKMKQSSAADDWKFCPICGKAITGNDKKLKR